MTILELTNKIKQYAENQYNHPKAMEGSVYTNLNTKELTYPCINIDNVNVVKRDNEVVYSYYVYYADRLNEDGSNTLQVQSEATTSLELILNKIAESGAMNLDEIPNVIITPYKMKFTDMCAGAWMQVSIHTLNGIDYCNDGSTINTIFVTANGSYDAEDYDRVNVDVPQYIVGDDWFYFKSREDGSKVGFHLRNGDPFNVNFEYSRDKIEWVDWDFSPLTVNSGETVYFRGNNASGFKPNPAQGPEYYFTTPSGSFNIGGDIRTLLAKVELPNVPPQYCFRYFFNNCSIVEVDKNTLGHFTALSTGCFADLFTNCTSLTKTPDLPYMTLAGECYKNLFNECRALETAPELPAKTINTSSYENLFHNCKNLTYVKCLATSGLSNAKNMTSGVNTTGVFIKDYAADWSGVQNGIPSGWTVKENEIELIDTAITINGTYTAELGKGFRQVTVDVVGLGGDFLKFTAKAANSVITLRYQYGSSIEYTFDAVTWNTMTTGTTITLANVGDAVYMRGIIDGVISTSGNLHNEFNIDGDVKVSGNIGYLFNKNNPNLLLSDYVGYRLFLGCAGLTDASGLILPTNFVKANGYTAQGCFGDMFRTCINLVSGPELPATEIEDVSGIYAYMFYGCISLTKAPSILPAKKTYTSAYAHMFDSCTSLKEAPIICAVSGGSFYCEGMFQNCVSLEKAPDLPDEVAGIGAYQQMFSGCSNLSYVRCLATDDSQQAYTQMLKGVNFIGTLVLNYNAPQEVRNAIKRDVTTSPYSWTVLYDNVPES